MTHEGQPNTRQAVLPQEVEVTQHAGANVRERDDGESCATKLKCIAPSDRLNSHVLVNSYPARALTADCRRKTRSMQVQTCASEMMERAVQER